MCCNIVCSYNVATFIYISCDSKIEYITNQLKSVKVKHVTNTCAWIVAEKDNADVKASLRQCQVKSWTTVPVFWKLSKMNTQPYLS